MSLFRRFNILDALGNLINPAKEDGNLATIAAKDFATQTTLAALNTKVTAVNTGAVTVAASALPSGAATESTLSSLNGKVTACNTGAVTVAASALPSGAATESTLSSLNGKVTACNTGAVVGAVKLIDEANTAYGVKHINNKPRVSAMPYTFDIAEGNVANHSPFSKIGFHASISTTELDIAPWMAGPYVFPTGATTMTIVSSSAQDEAAGTGARTVTVHYLTTAFAEKSETVTMNGTTPVQIATDIYRINKVRIATAGTTGAAVGNITVAAGGVTYGYISATKTRQRQAIYTVPAGKAVFITGVSYSCSDQSASKFVRFTLRANYDDTSDTVLQRGLFMPFNEITLNNSSFTKCLTMPIKFPATTDIKVSAVSNSAAAGTCSLAGWIEVV